MWRTTIAVAALLTAAPLSALAVWGGMDQANEPDPGTSDDGVAATDGDRILHLNGSAMLDGPMGAVVLAIGADEPTPVEVQTTFLSQTGWERTEGHGVLLWPAADPYPTIDLDVDSPGRAADVHAKGINATCCPVHPNSEWSHRGGGEARTVLEVGPDAPLHIGLMADGWGEGDTFEATLKAVNDTGLRVLERYSTDHVVAVDLAERPYDEGINARLPQGVTVGEPGNATITFDPEGTAVAGMAAYTDHGARLQVRMALSNGTTIGNGDGRNSNLWVHAAHQGQVQVQVSNVHDPEPGPLEQTRSGDPHGVLLLADLPIPREGLSHRNSPSEAAPMPDDGGTYTLTEEALSGPTGWVLVPVSAETETVVETRTVINMTAKANTPSGYAPITLLPDRPFVGAAEGRAWHGTLASASTQGTAVHCCPSPTGEPLAINGWDGEAEDPSFILGPNETAYLGMVVVNWTSDDHFTLQVRAEDGTPLAVGPPQAGERAWAMDLAHQARSAGTTVQLAGNHMAGQAGDVHHTFDLEQGGVVGLFASVEREAQAKVSLTLPNGTVHDNGDGRDVTNVLDGSTGPGTLGVSVTHLREPGPPRDGWVHATLIVADLPVPHHVLYQDLDRAP